MGPCRGWSGAYTFVGHAKGGEGNSSLSTAPRTCVQTAWRARGWEKGGWKSSRQRTTHRKSYAVVIKHTNNSIDEMPQTTISPSLSLSRTRRHSVHKLLQFHGCHRNNPHTPAHTCKTSISPRAARGVFCLCTYVAANNINVVCNNHDVKFSLNLIKFFKSWSGTGSNVQTKHVGYRMFRSPW